MNKSRIFLALLGTFLIGVSLGIVFTVLNLQFAENLFSNLKQLFGGKLDGVQDSFSLFKLIFLNNTRVAILAAFGGVLFGVVPLGILFFNGFLVGIVVEYSYLQGESLTKILLSILPHGIVEIPAFAIAGLGGIEWYLEIIKGEGTVGGRFIKGFKIAMKMLGIAIFLLLIAAFIEAYITPSLAGYEL
ncbi:stage II sporulation protein M [Thermococcus paralvinellae]|uniref:Stage II sporulation protein M n=1 Tax=Thermococcus paralvinellae TaxID=582419 RepID=W0I2J2_9EURY|nr:stage II sporulation protein M [Thermococcus paralvinellae]AHF80271.1 Hypothetical protein TES1_0885 [Thermococcus paralvinellae]